jgi:hypothetical protein
MQALLAYLVPPCVSASDGPRGRGQQRRSGVPWLVGAGGGSAVAGDRRSAPLASAACRRAAPCGLRAAALGVAEWGALADWGRVGFLLGAWAAICVASVGLGRWETVACWAGYISFGLLHSARLAREQLASWLGSASYTYRAEN